MLLPTDPHRRRPTATATRPVDTPDPPSPSTPDRPATEASYWAYLVAAAVFALAIPVVAWLAVSARGTQPVGQVLAACSIPLLAGLAISCAARATAACRPARPADDEAALPPSR
ncbi:hypothetical protein [Nocardioides sp. TF02-7]|uniref:hypothetical protein n=1 Tax=Nocardioides sp. TF02-7 TaxID=2917724 RepID=UPI001F0667B1|nr:hypothetical protein [Nocardioides sp. TF02-7]UMG92755.1 hypothetical protein MF408_24125 [Nocardioides sp. TF02-7]